MREAPIEIHRVGDARLEHGMSDRRRLLRRASPLLFALLGNVSAVRGAGAQLPAATLPLSNSEDARTLPKGTLRLRALNAWTRIDEVYDAASDSANPLHPLGQAFRSNALGVRELPSLLPAQNAMRALTGDPNLQLNLGQTIATADSRIVTTPFTLEYGVTNRLTLGVTVPVVQTHTTLFIALNPRSRLPSRLNVRSPANVGPNPALGNTTAQSANQALIASLGQARSALQSFVTSCQSSGSCSPQAVAQATQLIVQTANDSSAIMTLYGVDGLASPFAPLGATQTTIASNLTALQNTINGLIGSSFAFGAPTGANGIAALQQLQQLATALPGIGYDSLGSPDRIGVGDVEVSAAFKLLDSFTDSTRDRAFRALLRGVVRLPTGQTSFGLVPFEVGTGTHQTGGDLGVVFDARLSRRLMTTVAAQYTAYFTNATIFRVPNSDYALFPLVPAVPGTWREGNALQLEATPRIQLTNDFSFHGAYALRHQAAPQYTAADGSAPPTFDATTEQRVGLGFAYSTVNRYSAGRSSFPFEVFFTHLETIAASGGLTPKYRRDQLEFRIYYRLFRPGR
jgi:hypothetical protein